MAVKIRLNRIGSHKRPFYRIVVIDSRKARDAKYIEKLGHINPLSKEENNELVIDKPNTIAWLKKGAQPTKVVRDLLTKEKIWQDYTEEKSEKNQENSDKKPKKKKTRKSRLTPVSAIQKRREEKAKKENFKKQLAERKQQKEAEKNAPAKTETPAEKKEEVASNTPAANDTPPEKKDTPQENSTENKK